MAINVDLENFQYANNELEKTDEYYANAVSCIESVLNNLDSKVLVYVKEDLLDIKTSLSSMDDAVEIIQDNLINLQNQIKAIENKASQANDDLFSTVSTIGGAVAGTLTGGVVGGIMGGAADAGIAAYTNNIDTETGANVSKPKSVLDSFLTSAQNTLCIFFNKVGDAVTKTAATVGNFVTSAASKVATFLGNAGNGIWNAITHPVDTLKKVGASVANVVIGFLQGVGEFLEALVDTCAIVVTAVASVFTGLADLCQWIGGKITGNENWESVTKKMWGGTMNFVSTKYVQGAFQKFYEQKPIGKWLDANAYGPFKSTGAIYKVVDGIGYIAGVIALTIATMGIGGAAVGASSAGSGVAVNLGSVATVTISKQSIMMGVTAATAGLGKNTQNAWADGASLGEGLTYGSAMALWEGLQMFGGATVNSLQFVGASGVSGQLLTTASHVGLDMIDGASAGFIDPMMQMIYNPNETNMEQIMYLINYDENGNQISNKTWDELSFSEKYNALFQYNGGWATVGTGALAAGAVSFVSEIPDIRSAVKTAHGVGGATTPTITPKSDPVQPVQQGQAAKQVQPTKTEVPTRTVDPVQPVQQVQAAKQVQLTKPEVPTKTVDPIQSANFRSLKELDLRIKQLRDQMDAYSKEASKPLPDERLLEKIELDIERLQKGLTNLGFTKDELAHSIPLSTQRKLGVLFLTENQETIVNKILKEHPEIFVYNGKITFRTLGTVSKYISEKELVEFEKIFTELHQNLKQYKSYGADQGVFKIFGPDSKNVNYIFNPNTEPLVYERVSKIIRDKFPQITKQTDVNKMLALIDSKGACSYAATLNIIYKSYEGNEAAFHEAFGFDMYRIVDGKKVFNSEELLTDLYFTINDQNSILFKGQNGEFEIPTIAQKQAYFSSGNDGYNIDRLNEYLSIKGINKRGTITRFIRCGDRTTTSDIPRITEFIREKIANNESISIGIYYNKDNPNGFKPFNMKGIGCEDYSNAFWSGGGHAMIITGIDSHNFISITSWGKQYRIHISDLVGTEFRLESIDL